MTCTVAFALCWFPLYLFLIFVYFFQESPDIETGSDTPQAIQNTNDVSHNNFNGYSAYNTSNSDKNKETFTDNLRMSFLLLSYCNGLFNPLVLLIMSSSIRSNLNCFKQKPRQTNSTRMRKPVFKQASRTLSTVLTSKNSHPRPPIHCSYNEKSKLIPNGQKL